MTAPLPFFFLSVEEITVGVRGLSYVDSFEEESPYLGGPTEDLAEKEISELLSQEDKIIPE